MSFFRSRFALFVTKGRRGGDREITYKSFTSQQIQMPLPILACNFCFFFPSLPFVFLNFQQNLVCFRWLIREFTGMVSIYYWISQELWQFSSEKLFQTFWNFLFKVTFLRKRATTWRHKKGSYADDVSIFNLI